MDLNTGAFTVPRNGRYLISFTGIVDSGGTVCLRLNGACTAGGWGEPIHNTVSIQSVFSLKTGDWIDVYLPEATVYDDNRHFLHFIGILLEEDLF
jgi:hypothetical protein